MDPAATHSKTPQQREEVHTFSRFVNSIQTRLVFILLVLLIPAVIIQTLIYFDRLKSRREMEFQANLELARAVGEAFNRYIEGLLHEQFTIGIALTSPEFLSTKGAERILQESRDEYTAVRGFSWIDPHGRTLLSSRKEMVGLDLSDRSYIKNILDGKEWNISDLFNSRITGELVFTVSRAIRDEAGGLMGIVVASLSPEELKEIFHFERKGSGAIVIIDRKGMAVFRHPELHWNGETRNLLLDNPLTEQALRGEEITATTHSASDGIPRMFALTPIRSMGWVVGASRSEKESMAPVISYLLYQSGLFLATFICASLIALALARRMTVPIKRMQRHALAIGSGAWESWTEVYGPTEIQDLANALNSMAQEIESREKTIRTLANEAQKRAQEAEAGKKTLEALMDNIPEGITIADAPDVTIRMVSKYGQELVGRSAEIIEGFPCGEHAKRWALFYPDGITPARDDELPLTRATLHGEIVRDEEWVVKRPDGSQITILCNAGPIRDKANNTIAGVIAWRDVTELKKTEVALRRARDELETRVRERTSEIERANEELRSLPARLIAAQEEERRRLASELHDSIGQTLAALKFNVELILNAREMGGAEDALNLLDRFVPTMQRSIDETRAIYMGLRPRMLEERGIVETLYWYCREFMSLYPKHHVELQLGVQEGDISEDLKIAAFRIIQEGLNNVAKHSKAEWVDLSLVRNGDEIELTMFDDGVGVDLNFINSNATTARSLGLTGMRERAELTGGSITIESAPGEGTTVRVVWPSR